MTIPDAPQWFNRSPSRKVVPLGAVKRPVSRFFSGLFVSRTKANGQGGILHEALVHRGEAAEIEHRAAGRLDTPGVLAGSAQSDQAVRTGFIDGIHGEETAARVCHRFR
jgi:hypothetical protein